MLNQAKINLGARKKIKFIHADFLEWAKTQKTQKYDLIFSSRVVEYIPDKENFLTEIYNLLNKGSYAVISTKVPAFETIQPLHFIRNLLGKSSLLQSENISPDKFQILINKIKVNAVFYPINPVPIFRTLFRHPMPNFFKTQLTKWSKKYSEAYLIKINRND